MRNAPSDDLDESPELNLDIAHVVAIAHMAGEILLKHYHTDFVVHRKENQSPVTIADTEADAAICEALRDAFPYPILSEESKDDLNRMHADFVWCVDPMDGTKDFVKKTGDFCVMIGGAYKGKPVIGTVYLPTTGETFTAQKGKGAFVQKRGEAPTRLRTAQPQRIEDLRILLSRTSVAPFDHEVVRLLGLTQHKPAGSVGVKMTRIAQGEADLYVINNRDAHEWDTCAPEVILHEAGGRLTDMFGKPLSYNNADVTRPNGFIASNGSFHHEIVEGVSHLVGQLKEV